VNSTIECEAFQAALQNRLDGSRGSLPAAFELHRRNCENCAADFRAAELLLAGLQNRPMYHLPKERREQIFNAVIAESPAPGARREQKWGTAILALVACLMLAVMIGVRWSGSVPFQSKQSEPVSVASAPPISVDQSLAEATSTVAALTRRETPALGPNKWLPSETKSPRSWLNEPLPDPIQPAAKSLTKIREVAASGLEPVTNTARRAFALFSRDLPEASN
jgi:hypothetical protein